MPRALDKRQTGNARPIVDAVWPWGVKETIRVSRCGFWWLAASW